MENFDIFKLNLIPKKGIVNSRSECDTSVEFGKYTFKLPVYPANMESVINQEIALKLAKNGYFYTMHRFMTNEEQVKFITFMTANKAIVSISIGVTEDYYELIKIIREYKLHVDYITIDIAHGYSVMMEKMLSYILDNGIKAYIIAGNISTIEGAEDLHEWGADAVKVGIAPGKMCTTAMATRFGSRGIQASVIKEISDAMSSTNLKIIADGGIREHGDVAVALTMGADMVMAGGMFAGFKESPGSVIWIDNFPHKEYWGSASTGTSGKTNRIEGKKGSVPYKRRSILTEMTSIEESLQSAISYAGGRDLSAFLTTKYKIRNK